MAARCWHSLLLRWISLHTHPERWEDPHQRTESWRPRTGGDIIRLKHESWKNIVKWLFPTHEADRALSPPSLIISHCSQRLIMSRCLQCRRRRHEKCRQVAATIITVLWRQWHPASRDNEATVRPEPGCKPLITVFLWWLELSLGSKHWLPATTANTPLSPGQLCRPVTGKCHNCDDFRQSSKLSGYFYTFLMWHDTAIAQ